jgi:hypothetical protein
MTRFPHRTARRLADPNQWLDRRLRARARSHGDGGFVLLESIMSISLIMIMTAALAALFISTSQATNHLRIRQVAVQLADSGVERVRAYQPDMLQDARDPDLVEDQYRDGLAGPPSDKLSTMLATVADPYPASGTGKTPARPTVPGSCPAASEPTHIPTSPVCQAIGNRPFLVSYYLANCYVPTSGTAACLASKPAGEYLKYLRAVVAVTWANDHCANSSCLYVTNTLIDDNPDPRFKVAYPVVESPDVVAPDRMSNVGDTVPFNPAVALRTGTGVAPFTWAATNLPPGLKMAADGTITGTIKRQAVGTMAYTVTVTVVDGLIQRKAATFTWTVRQPTITSPGNQSTVISTPISLPVVATCWKPTCTYTVSGAPSWLSINPATGVLTGTPTAVGTTSGITVSVTDGNGITATTDPFDWVVVPTPAAVCVTEIALTNGSFEAPALNTSVPVNTFNYVTTGAPNWMRGGDSPLQWDTTEPDGIVELWHNGFNVQSANGGQPISAEDGSTWAELNANATGALYQDLATDPGVVLQWSVWHRGRYSSLANASKKDVMQVQIGSTTSQAAQIPTGQATTAISDGPTAWVLYRGFYVVPPGQTTTRFQFAAISTASGNNSIGNFIDNLSLNNKVACVEKLPDPQTSTVGTAIAGLQLSAIRGSGNYTWSGGSTLPAGLSISASGLISGTPTTVGTNSVGLILTDTQTTYSTTVPFTWTVVPKPTITAPSTQTTSVGGVVNLSVTSSCLNRPCIYTMNTGPAGLTVSSGGVITGTITSAAQNFNNVTITVQDKAGVQATTSPFIWKVVSGPGIVNPGNQKTLRGAAAILSVSASGGIGTLSYAASGLPSWLTINSVTGLITGVAPASTDSTTSGITITVSDSQNASATTAAFSWIVYSSPTVTAPANQSGTIGSTVNVNVVSTCPNAPCTFTISGQPSGVTINNSGVISGTISGTPATFPNVRVTITDAAGASARSNAFTWTTSYAPLQATTPLAQTSTINTAITPLQLTASGTSGSYAWTGTLPAGLSMTSGGLISGTPTSAIPTTPITLTVTDTVTANTMNITFNWAVVAKPTITAPTNQTTTLGAAINLPLTSSCPNSPCTYLLNSGPTGLSINSSGVVTGTVGGIATTYNTVSVRVTDAAGAFNTSTTFTWTVKAKPTIAALAAQKTSVGAGVNLAAPVPTCPNASCTLTLNNGPTGLSIVGSTITGTVGGSAQTYNVTITVTDAAGVTGVSPVFTWTVLAKPTIAKPANQTTTVGSTTTSLQLTSSCSNTPCTYALNNGPSGLSINSTGLITGTITSSAQTFNNASVTITDAAGVSVTSTPAFSWVVNPAPTVTAPASQTSTVGNAISLQLVPSCPNTPCSYALNNGPATLAINSSGLITGTITSAAQTFSNVTVRITDAAGVGANSTVFAWTVNAATTITDPPNQKVNGGAAVSFSVAALKSGGTAPFTYSATGLPSWLSIVPSTGVISGNAPSTRGFTSAITVKATDSTGSSATSGAFQWFVNYPSIAIPNQLTKVSTAASIDLDNYTTGGTAPYAYVITNKPSWLTYTSATHVLSGNAPSTASTTSNITVAATDSASGVVTSAAFTWKVVASSGIVWSAIAAKSSVPNVAITSVNVTGSVSGATTNTFTAVGLPPGLTISVGGVISGTPTLPGLYRVTVSANDSLGQAVPSTPFSWQVTSMTLGTVSNQFTVRSTADSFDVSTVVTAGVGPYTYSAAGLPAWLSINASTGVISGTAPSTTSTTSGITVTVTDLTGAVLTTVSFSWSVT